MTTYSIHMYVCIYSIYYIHIQYIHIHMYLLYTYTVYNSVWCSDEEPNTYWTCSRAWWQEGVSLFVTQKPKSRTHPSFFLSLILQQAVAVSAKFSCDASATTHRDGFTPWKLGIEVHEAWTIGWINAPVSASGPPNLVGHMSYARSDSWQRHSALRFSPQLPHVALKNPYSTQFQIMLINILSWRVILHQPEVYGACRPPLAAFVRPKLFPFPLSASTIRGDEVPGAPSSALATRLAHVDYKYHKDHEDCAGDQFTVVICAHGWT